MNEIVIANLRRIMKSKGIDTSYGFIKLGIPAQLVDAILKHGNPKVNTLQRLAEALDVDIKEFFRIDG